MRYAAAVDTAIAAAKNFSARPQIILAEREKGDDHVSKSESLARHASQIIGMIRLLHIIKDDQFSINIQDEPRERLHFVRFPNQPCSPWRKQLYKSSKRSQKVPRLCHVLVTALNHVYYFDIRRYLFGIRITIVVTWGMN